jgi:putative transposase
VIETAESLSSEVGVSAACRALGVPRSTLYHARKPPTELAPRPTPPRAMSAEEKAEVRDVLNSERFWDCAPREVYAVLLDEGVYYCYWRTMYRILAEYSEVCERRNQRRHPSSTRPELRATGPNQLWSWDITYLKGTKGVVYYLYMIIDVYSRYIVGWLISNREAAELAEQLIAATCAKEGIESERLTLHADRGSAMRSKTVAQLLIALGVSKSHSRPRTPTDNPYSEAQFKTMKYRPDYPQEFSTMKQARDWVREFVQWYNHEHHHTGLALMPPAVVHHGQVEQVGQQRQQVLDAAYAAHPERFVRGKPTLPKLPDVVWINEPKSEHQIIGLAGSAASDGEPGAQAGSRA